MRQVSEARITIFHLELANTSDLLLSLKTVDGQSLAMMHWTIFPPRQHLLSFQASLRLRRYLLVRKFVAY